MQSPSTHRDIPHRLDQLVARTFPPAICQTWRGFSSSMPSVASSADRIRAFVAVCEAQNKTGNPPHQRDLLVPAAGRVVPALLDNAAIRLPHRHDRLLRALHHDPFDNRLTANAGLETGGAGRMFRFCHTQPLSILDTGNPRLDKTIFPAEHFYRTPHYIKKPAEKSTEISKHSRKLFRRYRICRPCGRASKYIK